MTTHQAALEAAGDRLGTDFRLGERTGQWSTTRYRTRVGCASAFAFVAVLFGWIPVAVIGGRDRLTAAEIFGAALFVAIVLASIPPRRWENRLFRFEHGLAVVDPQQAAPAVLRWEDLTSIKTRVAGGDEDRVVFCELGDRAGQALPLGSFGTAATEIKPFAERLLAQRLLPPLVARYDAGEPVFFGLFTVEQWGLSAPGGASGMRWRVSWPEIGHIEVTKLGNQLVVQDTKGPLQTVSLQAEPNAFLARHLVAHAARRAGIDVIGPQR